MITLKFQEKAVEKLEELCKTTSILKDINSQIAGKGEALNMEMTDFPAESRIMLKIVSPWKCDPSRYCKEHALKHTAMRGTQGWMSYQFTKDSLKKHRLGSLRARQEGTISIVEIVPLERFNYTEFLRSVVDLPTDKHIVRLFCESKVNMQEL